MVAGMAAAGMVAIPLAAEAGAEVREEVREVVLVELPTPSAVEEVPTPSAVELAAGEAVAAAVVGEADVDNKPHAKTSDVSGRHRKSHTR